MSSKLKRLIPALLIPVLAAAVLVFFLMQQEISFADGDSLVSHKVFWGSTLPFPEENCPEGYIFAGWKDEDGILHNEDSLKVQKSGLFTAEYRLLFSRVSDEPFIFADENGFFNLDKPVSRGDMIAVLSGYFAVKADDTASFSDISVEERFYEAACALKSLGIYTEDKLEPDTALTGEELRHVLSFFHTDSAFSADELPAGELSLLELIKAVSLASGCTGPKTVPSELNGAVPDLAPEDENYAFALEAAVKHSHRDGLCDWSDYEAIRSFEAGLFDINNVLYYAHEDGSLARDEEAVGLYFGEDGRYTTGMEELDELVLEILGGLVNDEMSSIDKLKAAYYYVLDNSKYIKGNIYERGETGWCEDEGYSMLSRGYGNCYGYAAAFCQLARAIGYDAHAFSGYMGADYDPHGWVEIEIDGENYYFDPQLEMSCRMRHEYDSLFMVSEQSAHKWSYVH